MIKYFYVIFLLFGCSLRSEDVLLKWESLSEKSDFLKFDETLTLETKKLRDRNPYSLHAHMAYLIVRRGSKALKAEYDKIFQEKKSPLYQFILLKIDHDILDYRKNQERMEIVSKMEKLALESSDIKEEALFHLATNLIRDKKKRREYAEYLLKQRPKYSPYLRLMANQYNAIDDGAKIIEMCRVGLNTDSLEFGFCAKLATINIDNNRELVKERDELLRVMMDKSLKKEHKKVWTDVYFDLGDLIDSGEKQFEFAKKEYVTKILKIDPTWIPIESYKKYYGEMDYDGFVITEELGKINKKLEFKERIEDLLKLSQKKDLPSHLLASIYSNLAYAYQNPANLDKNKAYEYFIKSNELKPGNVYLVSNLLGLILDLNKDPDIGLMLIEENLALSVKKNEEFNVPSVRSAHYVMEGVKNALSNLYYYQGRLFLKKKEEQRARIAFLNSLALEDTELAAFFLGKLYQKENPLLAIDFLGKSLKNADPEKSMDENFISERDALLKTLYQKYYGDSIDKKSLIAVYIKDNDSSGGESPKHPFLGKPIVTMPLNTQKDEVYDWSQLKGKKVILSFWATWCTPCFQEMAVLNKIMKQGKIKDLKIVGVCTDGISQKKKVLKILEEGKIEFDIVLDDGTFRDKYFVSAIPSMFFLDKKNEFILHKTGYSPKLEDEIFKVFQ